MSATLEQPGLARTEPRGPHQDTDTHALRRAMSTRVARFLAIGLVSTIAYALLYLGLRGPLGAELANALALALTAVANTQANRCFTFGIHGRVGLLRQHMAGALVYLLALALTWSALALLHGLGRHPSGLLELATLPAASTAATVTRYLALRAWVFRRPRAPKLPPTPLLD